MNIYAMELERQRITAIFVFLFLWLGMVSGIGQSSQDLQVKRLQRAIFVYNFAEQVLTGNTLTKEFYTIGVLGKDRAQIDLTALSKNRQINGKPVRVKSFNLVKEITAVDLLYVNEKFHYDIDYIFSKISNKNTLLVTEDYKYNASMINMINVGNSFEYEINVDHIIREGFAISPSLRRHAVSSAEKWKELYKYAQNSLNESKKKQAEQAQLLLEKDFKITSQQKQLGAQENTIDTIVEVVDQQTEQIQYLWTEKELQGKKYKEKLAIEKALTNRIRAQVGVIKQQETKIGLSTQKIEEQHDFLASQEQQIAQNTATLKLKDSEIDYRRKMNWLLAALVLITLLGSFFLYRNYLVKKRLTKTLEEKNTAIEEQAAILESKNNELEQFAYIASHDLKEPLITISSLINMVVEDYSDKFDAEGKESLSYITGSANRMTQLIDDLLEYSRLGSKRVFKQVDTQQLVKTLKVDLNHIIERSGANIHLIDLPTVKGSEVELRLLFQNLISNAIKFVVPKTTPHIEILCTQKGTPNVNSEGYWEFSVTDNGIGIPEVYKDRVFSIFQRLHGVDEYEGTGIGLAHCKKIVEAHGGEIWLESTEGEGTTVYFTIPF